MSSVAIIMAAGLGVRYGGNVPKPALQIAGKPLIIWSVEALLAGGCEDIVVVANLENRDMLATALREAGLQARIVLGGRTRQESVRCGLQAITAAGVSENDVVLIHDAVRPLVPASVVAEVIAAVEGGASAVAPAIPVIDSVRELSGRGSSVVARDRLRAIQTPQGFPLALIAASHEAAATSGLVVTDDLACAEAAGHRVVLVSGSRMAIKVTEPVDLVLAEALWQQQPESLSRPSSG